MIEELKFLGKLGPFGGVRVEGQGGCEYIIEVFVKFPKKKIGGGGPGGG